METKQVVVTATDGTTVKISVPAWPLPVADRHAILKTAFSLVTPERHDPSKDWKDEIDVIITGAELREKNVSLQDVIEAVEFFTATEAIPHIVEPKGCKCSAYRICAKGYRRGPAA